MNDCDVKWLIINDYDHCDIKGPVINWVKKGHRKGPREGGNGEASSFMHMNFSYKQYQWGCIPGREKNTAISQYPRGIGSKILQVPKSMDAQVPYKSGLHTLTWAYTPLLQMRNSQVWRADSVCSSIVCSAMGHRQQVISGGK